jgi:hypothetical protein
MKATIEDLLAASMRDEVAGLRPAPDLVARAARRHRQRSRVRLAVSVAGTAGVAAAVAIGLTVASAGAGANRTGRSAERAGGSAVRAGGPAASSPRARLVAAMITSAQLSYRLHLVNTSTSPGHRMTPTSPSRDLINWYADYTGVYNPRTGSGTGVNIMRLQSGTLAAPSSYGEAVGYMQVRIIGSRYYTRSSGDDQHWRSGHGTLVQALVLNGGRAWAPTTGASADPSVLLTALRRMGSVTFAGQTGTGAKALDTYDFRYRIAGDGSVKAHELTGTIVVHAQSNLIAKITIRTTVTGSQPQLADGGRTTFTTVMTFSDYGVPVSVQAPTGAIQQLKLLPGS